jgi:hypothetical protein
MLYGDLQLVGRVHVDYQHHLRYRKLKLPRRVIVATMISLVSSPRFAER